MMTRVRSVLSAAVAAIVLAAAPAARAEFAITVTEFGGPPIPIVDGGPLDTDGLANGLINVNTSALNVLLVNFQFNSLSGNSTALFGAGNDPATIGQIGDVYRTDTGGNQSITITASDINYLSPTGNPKGMGMAATDIFSNTTAGDSRTFQSTFNGVVNSPLLTVVPPVGLGPFGSGLNADTPLGSQPTPFTLSNTTLITLGSFTAGGAQEDKFAGSTTISDRSVPEPASLALLALGVPVTALLSRRRVARP